MLFNSSSTTRAVVGGGGYPSTTDSWITFNTVASVIMLIALMMVGCFSNPTHGKTKVDKIASVGVSTETTGSVFFDGTGDYLAIPNRIHFDLGTLLRLSAVDIGL